MTLLIIYAAALVLILAVLPRQRKAPATTAPARNNRHLEGPTRQAATRTQSRTPTQAAPYVEPTIEEIIAGIDEAARKDLERRRVSIAAQAVKAEKEKQKQAEKRAKAQAAAILARADIDRWEALKLAYIRQLDAIEAEINDDGTPARRVTILTGQAAAVEAKINNLDRKIEIAYNTAQQIRIA